MFLSKRFRKKGNVDPLNRWAICLRMREENQYGDIY